MLDNDYVAKVQAELDKRYSTGLDEVGDHTVRIYRADDTDDAIIARHPITFDGQDNDEVPAELKRFLVIRLIAKDGKWQYLVNQQFIHASKFTGKSYTLCLNQFKNNKLTEKGHAKLKQDLMSKFGVKLSYNGLLIIKAAHKFITAYDYLVKAIQFIEANGEAYTQQGNINPAYEAEKELRMEQDAIRDADSEFKSSKTKSHQPSKAKRTKQVTSKKSTKPLVKKQKPVGSTNSKKYDLSGKKVVAIGRLNHTKASYRRLLKKHGGSLQSHVSSKTQAVICNKPNKSKEYQKAVKLHLPIIKESDIKF